MNHYPHHIGDFDKATRHLTRLERSVYRDLLDMYYDTEAMIPLDLVAVCRKILARSNEEATAVEQTLNEFFTKTPTGWYHDRCEAEIAAYHSNTTQKALAGKASANARMQKRAETLEKLNGNPTDVEQPLNSVATEAQQNPTNQNQNQNQNHLTTTVVVVGSAKRRTQIAETFEPNDAGVQTAVTRGVQVDAELQRFIDYHRAKGSVMADWQAAWRTWVGNAAKFTQPNAPRGRPAESFAERDERAARERFEEATGRTPRNVIDITPATAHITEVLERLQ